MRTALARTGDVVTSDLTLVECSRALIRAQSSLGVPGPEIARRRAWLDSTVDHWSVLRMTREIVARARRPFPAEPIRALDALHLATALVAAETSNDFSVLSLDRRVRASARGLGLTIAP